MNNDLISRSALKKAFNELTSKKFCGYRDFEKLIDNTPPIEYTFEEAFQKTVCENKLYCPARPHGEWIICNQDNEGIHKIECPFCKYVCGSDFGDQITMTFQKLPNYCEQCGADMRKEVGNNDGQ